MSLISFQTGNKIEKDILLEEMNKNNINRFSKQEHVRWVDTRDGSITIESVSDYRKYNGGSSKPNHQLDLFVPAHL